VGFRAVAFAGVLLAATACSSGASATVTCRVTLGKQTTRVVLNAASRTPTPLGIDDYTARFSRVGNGIRISVFGPSLGPNGSVGQTNGHSMNLGVKTPRGVLSSSCRE
jgi:hypothetical protein